MIRSAFVIVVSDRAHCGEREDVSGKALVKSLEESGFKVTGYEIVPDEMNEISSVLKRVADSSLASLILTTGGTGFAMRDVTPEATLSVSEKAVPGISELIRLKCSMINEKAALSRGVSVIRNKSLIVNLPGSPSGALESLNAFIKIIPHGLELLSGSTPDG